MTRRFLVIFLLLACSSPAAVDIYLQLSDVPGEFEDKAHNDWIEVLSFSHGISNAVNIASGIKGSGKVNIGEFSLTKYVDRSTAALMQKMTNGKLISEGTLDVVRQSGKGEIAYVRLKFRELILTSVTMYASGGDDRPVEQISFAATRIDWEYTEISSKGEPQPAIFAFWDQAVNKGGEGGVSNATPVISKISNQSGDANTTKTVLFTVNDAETAAGSLKVTANSSNRMLLPDNGIVLSGNSANRNIKLSPAAGETGQTTVSVTVSDGNKSATTSFVFTVRASNTQPVLSGIPSNRSTNDNTPFAPFAGSGLSDAQNDALQVMVVVDNTTVGGWTNLGSFSQLVTGRISAEGQIASILTSLRGLTFTPVANRMLPGESATVNVTITANDGVTDEVSASTQILVTAVDDPPVFEPVADQEIDEGAEFSLAISARNVDGDGAVVRYSLDAGTLALGATIDPVRGTFRWTPTESQGPGTYTITVRAQDTISPARVASLATTSFQVSVREQNAPPVILVNTLDIGEGQTVVLSEANFDARDPDNTDVDHVVTVVSVEFGAFRDEAGPINSFTMSELGDQVIRFVHDGSADAPAYTLRISDGILSATAAASVFFNSDNDPPSLFVGEMSISEGETLGLHSEIFSASDEEDADASLQFSISELIGGQFQMQFGREVVTEFTQGNTMAGSIQFTHLGGEIPPSFSVTVTDSGGRSTGPLPVTINYSPVNDPPVLRAPEAQEVDALNPLRLEIEASDPDRPFDTLTYTLDAASIALGAAIDPLSGEFSWTPSEAQVGTHTITLHVTDDDSQNPLSDTATFEITVDTALLARTGGTQEVTERSVVTLDGSGSVGATGLSQEWTQVEGPAVELSNARSGTPSFVAPVVDGPTLLRFELVVTTTDNESSEPATLDVIVNINDSDNDGLRDQWEVANFGDLRFSAGDDPNGDGTSNEDEFNSGTDPFSLSIDLETGWNLISLSREPIDNSVVGLFGNKVSGPVWTWDAKNRHFMTVDYLTAGQGYWVMANRDCTGENALIIHLP